MDWTGADGLEEGDVVLYPSPRRLAVQALIGLGVLALALLIIADAFAWEVRGKFLFLSYVSAPFTAYLGVKSLLGILAPSPSLVASRGGIYHNTGLGSYGAIPWEEVCDVVCHRFKGIREQVCIVPVNSDMIIARQPWFRRVLLHTLAFLAINADSDAPSAISIDWGDMSETAEETRLRILGRRPVGLPPPPETEDWGG